MATARDVVDSSRFLSSLDKNETASGYIDFRSKDLKDILKDNLDDLINVLNTCKCHTSDPCQLSRERHELVSQTIQMQQRIMTNDEKRPAQLSRQMSIDFSTPNTVDTTDRAQKVAQYQRRGKHSYETLNSYESVSSGYHSLDDDNDQYRIKKGYMLIIANIWFDGKPLDPRNGAAEEAKIIETFFEQFGFFVYTEYNATKDNVHHLLQELANSQTLEDYDCFALVITSHGCEEGILGTDNVADKFESIANEMKKCKSMVGKPKLFFFQCCRGNEKDGGQTYMARGNCNDIVRDGKKSRRPLVYRVPTDSETLIVAATSQGRYARSDLAITTSGQHLARSWLFEAMEQVFWKYADREDLMSMMTRVNKHVSMLGDEEQGKQMPCQMSTLTKKVFLTKKINNGTN